MNHTLLAVLVFTLAAVVSVQPSGAAENILIDEVRIAVNNKAITAREVEEYRSLQIRELNSRYSGEELQRELAALDRRLVDEMIEDLLIEVQAEILKVEISDRTLSERVDSILRRDPKMAEIYTEEQIKSFIYKDMLRRNVLAREVDNRVYVDPKEVVAACRNETLDTRELDIGHILVRGQSDAGLKALRDIRSQLVAGADFEKMAEQYSQDPSARNNKGRLGFVSRGQFVKPFEDKAFSMKPGELSEPVKTEFGYHLIKIFGERSKGAVDCEHLDEMANQSIFNRIYQQHREKQLREFLARLKEKADVRVFAPGGAR